MSEKERQELVDRTEVLEAYQSAEDRPEDLEKIPVLKREDISRKIAPIF